MAICKECRWVNPDGIRYCRKCGRPIRNDYIPEKKNDKTSFGEYCSTTELDVTLKNDRVAWNWLAFFFGGIWAAFHKLYWPLAVQLLYVLFNVFVPIPSPPPGYDEFMEGRFVLTDWQCVLKSLDIVLCLTCIAIHIVLAKRGNALRQGMPLFRQFTRERLATKKFNWLAMFGGGGHGFVLRQYWMSVPWVTVGLIILIVVINLLGYHEGFYVNVLHYLVGIGIFASFALAVLSGSKTNVYILDMSKTDAECISIYNKCRWISLGGCFVIIWFAIFIQCVLIYGL